MRCWFHKWSKWELYEWRGVVMYCWTSQQVPVTELRQRRSCEVCGKTQDKRVRDG